MNKVNAITNSKIKIKAVEWYITHYTLSLDQYRVIMKQVVDRKPTQLRYPEKSVFMKEVNTENFWTFELGTQQGFNIPTWIFTVFHQGDREHDQHLNNDSFCRLPLINAQCVTGTERYPDSAMLLNYDDDEYSQRYGEIKEAFRALTHDNILQPRYKSEDDYRSSNGGNNFVYNKHTSDKQYQKNFENAQQVKVEFIFSEKISVGIYGYALVLTNRLASISSAGQRMFDLT